MLDIIKIVFIYCIKRAEIIKIDRANAVCLCVKAGNVINKVISDNVSNLAQIPPHINCAGICNVFHNIVNFVVFNDMVISVKINSKARQIVNFAVCNAVSHAGHINARLIGLV